MSNLRRILALVLCAGLLTVLCVSSAYMVMAAGHDCAGECCHTCAQISRVRAVLRVFALAVFLLCALLFWEGTACSLLSGRRDALLRPATLVHWKVRLNN